jgi:hypothetical protein
MLGADDTPLCKLVCGGASRVFTDFETPFVDDEWARKLTANPTTAPIADHLVELQVHLSLHHAAGYYRRIVKPKLQRLGLAPPLGSWRPTGKGR